MNGDQAASGLLAGTQLVLQLRDEALNGIHFLPFLGDLGLQSVESGEQRTLLLGDLVQLLGIAGVLFGSHRALGGTQIGALSVLCGDLLLDGADIRVGLLKLGVVLAHYLLLLTNVVASPCELSL